MKKAMQVIMWPVGILVPIVSFLWAQWLIFGRSGTARSVEVASPVPGRAAQGVAERIYEAEHSRRARLEDKLRGQLAYTTFLLPIGVAIAARGFKESGWLLFFGALAIFHLISMLLLGLLASRAKPIQFLDVHDLQRLASTPGVDQQQLAVQGRMLESIALNMPAAWEIGNAVTTSRDSVTWAVLIEGVALGLILAGNFGG